MTDEERVFEVLNGKTRIWRFTAEEQGGFLSDIAQTLPATFAQLTDTLGYYEDRGQESIVCDSGDGFVNKLRPMRPSILTGYLAPLANIVYHNRLFPEERYTLENIYVSGELQDIDEDLVYKWFGQLASALDYIHGEGIVHRDIKPSNLLGDKAKRVAQSSKRDEGRNTDERIKRMLSLEQRATLTGRSEDLRGFHTQQEDSPWIMLELDKRRQITGLVIESWDWCTRPLRVWVSDDGKNEKGAPIARDDLGHKCYRFDLQRQNITTKYLIIGRERGAVKDWFYLDKVLIYGKDK